MRRMRVLRRLLHKYRESSLTVPNDLGGRNDISAQGPVERVPAPVAAPAPQAAVAPKKPKK